MADEVVTDPNANDATPAIGESVLIKDTPPQAPTAPQEPQKVDPGDGVFEYEPTGDVGLDMALDFMGKAGLHQDHPAMVAATQGDFSILKATLAQKGVTGWEQFVALGEAAYSRTTEAAAAKTAKLQEMVYAEAGGKEEWSAIQQWAGQNATPEEKAQINALLNQGGLAAKGAVKYLVDTYNRANNVVVQPREAAANAGRAGGTPSVENGPLSPRAYADAVAQLNGKLGGRLEGSKEYEALQRRRSAYRG